MIDESEWTFWRKGTTLDSFGDFEPRLASWDRHDAKSQVRLRAYLDEVLPRLLAAFPIESPAFLHLEVGAKSHGGLLTGYDLENYLTPLFGPGKLPAADFVLVTARKRVGGASLLSIGRAIPDGPPDGAASWSYWGDAAGSGCQSQAWKRRIHDGLAGRCPEPLAAGPVDLRVVWRAGRQRDWKNLWKPTCDSMGPVLGHGRSHRQFDPQDDRVTSLAFHQNVDPSKGHDVDVGVWWRLAAHAERLGA